MRVLAAGFSLLALLAAGCGGMGPTIFLHPEYNFDYVEKVAVVPFENLSTDQGAGARATRFFVSELLSTETFEVIEPGEVERALSKHGVVRTAELTREQIVAIGKELGVQGLFFGSIGESADVRQGGDLVSFVSIVARLVETDTGATIWSATHTAGGRGFWSTLFGTSAKSRSEVTRECVRECIDTLLD